MFPPLDLPKYSFFFLNFTKLFTFVLLSNEGARVTMWVPMLVLAACIYFVCKDRAKKFARFVDSWSHVIQIIDVVRCMQANHSVLSNTWRWGWPRFEQSKVFFVRISGWCTIASIITYQLLPYALRDCVITKNGCTGDSRYPKPLVHINFHSSTNDNKFLNFISSLKQVTHINCIPRL